MQEKQKATIDNVANEDSFHLNKLLRNNFYILVNLILYIVAIYIRCILILQVLFVYKYLKIIICKIVCKLLLISTLIYFLTNIKTIVLIY